MVKKKLGLAGRSGSGKDVLADYIGSKYGYTKIAVADAIRDEAKIFLTNALVKEQIATLPDFPTFKVVIDAFAAAVSAKPTTPEMRIFLQWWGTEYRRSQDTDYWVKTMQTRLMETDLVVVSDVRVPIEVETIWKADGEVWYIDRPGIDPVGIPNHLTEVALSGVKFDRIVRNTGTLDDLEKLVDEYFAPTL